MEEKKPINIRLSTVILVIVILALIGGIVYFIKQNSELITAKEKSASEVQTLQGKIQELENTISDIRNMTTNIISNEVNTASNINSTNSNNTITSENSTNTNTNSIAVNSNNISNYRGDWYESKEYSTGKNPNNLNIKKINGNQIAFDLYLTRTANFDNVYVTINNNIGTFEAISDNGPSKTDENSLGHINGNIELNNNIVKLIIKKSDVLYLEDNTEITFTYKE